MRVKNVQDICHEAIGGSTSIQKDSRLSRIENARFVCEDHYALFKGPPIQLLCPKDLVFPYVPGHLYASSTDSLVELTRNFAPRQQLTRQSSKPRCYPSHACYTPMFFISRLCFESLPFSSVLLLLHGLFLPATNIHVERCYSDHRFTHSLSLRSHTVRTSASSCSKTPFEPWSNDLAQITRMLSHPSRLSLWKAVRILLLRLVMRVGVSRGARYR